MLLRGRAGRAEARAFLLATLLAAAPCVGEQVAQSDGRTPTQSQIDRAVEIAKADPALASEKSVRSLRWGKQKDAPGTGATPRRSSGLFDWLGDLFSWIAEASRLLLWVVIAALSGLLGLLVFRFVRSFERGPRAPKFFAPTHVQDLDIRPQSLPDDIGAAARTLWDGGNHRAALALLYRGLLSRLAHTHRLSIRDSSTEGDCLALAARALDAQRLAYATRLVRVWQGAIYGGNVIDAPVMHELCANFAPHLDTQADVRPLRAAGAAS